MMVARNVRGRMRLVASAMAASALLALSGLSTVGRAATSEQGYETADSALYAVARQYFPGDETAMASRRIFRLTRTQIDATVAALLPTYFKASVATVMNRDPLQTNYEYADMLTINAANFAGLSKWISEIAERVKANPSGVINCVQAKEAPACLKTEARAFAIKAFRGDVGEPKLEQLTTFYLNGVKQAGFAQATGELVEVVLNSPQFLFRREFDTSDRDRLSPAQLLSAVTYTLADAPPEAVDLNSKSAATYLATGASASGTINAIVASKSAEDKLVRFFKAWLEVKDPSEFTISRQVFAEFTPQLASAMVDETERFLRTNLAQSRPSLKDITQSTTTVVTPALAPIFGVKSDGGQKPTKLDGGQRLGVFTSPGVIASHSGPTDSRLIKRGTFWVRKVMCMELEPPPADLHVTIVKIEGATERQKVEATTKPAACAGCHKHLDQFGFAFENYDALGRWRTSENGQPIDPGININFLDEEPVKTKTAVEALKTLTGSMMFKQCFVRQMFRFYMGRNEEPADDPLLRRMFFEFAHKDEQSLHKMIFMLASSDRLVRRQ